MTASRGKLYCFPCILKRRQIIRVNAIVLSGLDCAKFAGAYPSPYGVLLHLVALCDVIA